MKKQFTIRRFLALFSALALCLSLSVSAFAATNAPYIFEEDGVIFTINNQEGNPPALMRMPKYHVNLPDLSGVTYYSDSFTCDPLSGNDMDFTVENKGDCTIYLNITYKDTVLPEYIINPGDPPATTTFQERDGTGLKDVTEFSLSTKNPSLYMHCSVTAYQY